MATSEQVAKVVGLLTTVYPQYAKDRTDDEADAAMAMYQELLADIPADILDAAAKQHIASSRFFPTIAELRELAAKLMRPASAERTADQAWGDVKRAVAGYYPYADRCEAPEIADPIAAAIVKDMGGLHYLFASENEVSDRAQFIKAYEARQRRAQDDALLLPEARRIKELAAADTSAALALPEYSTNGNGYERAADIRALIDASAQILRRVDE